MSIDVIGDMATAIRNACILKKKSVFIPYSRFKENILGVLKSSGYITSFDVVPSKEGFGKQIKVTLKYVDGESVIHKITRISKPGLRKYKRSKDLKPVISGLGVGIVSTSKGVLTDIQARKIGVGGEVLLEVW